MKLSRKSWTWWWYTLGRSFKMSRSQHSLCKVFWGCVLVTPLFCAWVALTWVAALVSAPIWAPIVLLVVRVEHLTERPTSWLAIQWMKAKYRRVCPLVELTD